ncbi:hypothetical protein [Actinomadura rudentiformis]|uniref:hypothetical protein n=1 Tax=Actinomadura rudentiformis TaxID=359158 RepID=UPI00178C6BCD|nr:hypothetical protein [Actinomadura rudentiformis]
MALPLPEDMAAALAVGQLVRVNHDGTPYTGPDTFAATGPPSVKDSKRDWVAWAVSSGADPENAAAATKHDLIERYGKATPTVPAAGDQEDVDGTDNEPGERDGDGG